MQKYMQLGSILNETVTFLYLFGISIKKPFLYLMGGTEHSVYQEKSLFRLTKNKQQIVIP